MDDLFVLLQMPMTKLVYLTKKTHLESTVIPHGNRIYYFASSFEVWMNLFDVIVIWFNLYFTIYIYNYILIGYYFLSTAVDE